MSWCWWGRTAPARPIAWRRSRFCRRDAACGAPRWRTSPTTRATAPGRCPPRSRARWGLPRSAPASMRRRREADGTSRRCRIDREPVSSATAFGDHLRMVWLTPAMDGLFLGAASERRRFFDRLVLAIDSEHSSRVSALERSLRSRNRLLEVRNYDDHWCDAIERETAELAVAVAATRGQTVTRLAGDAARARRRPPPFPRPQIMLDGWMENALVNEPATAVEDRYREILRDSRAARRRRRPHARRPASHRSAGDLRAEKHAGARRLHRRAEGAADRAGAGACHAWSPR